MSSIRDLLINNSTGNPDEACVALKPCLGISQSLAEKARSTYKMTKIAQEYEKLPYNLFPFQILEERKVGLEVVNEWVKVCAIGLC